jgi:membrane fusion protein, heavy metal efflux system
MSKRWLVVGLITLLAAIVVVGFFWLRSTRLASPAAERPVTAPDISDTGEPSREITISLNPKEVQNAGLKTEEARIETGRATPVQGLRTTGNVQSNAYKDVPVYPLAGGLVREINVVLGDRVARGQRLATIFSTELSEAQTAYLALQADIERHHQHFRRTVQLSEIGAVSREELETVEAEYKTEQARLAAARQRLIFLGMKPKQIDSLITVDQMSAIVPVESPSSGVVLSRTINQGELVGPGKELFRITDLSTVWIVAQVFENDFASVRVGTPATVSSPAFGGRTFQGQVTYLDPRIEPQTRTAQVRIDVNNRSGLFRLGMFVDVNFSSLPSSSSASTESHITVPRSAIQKIGSTDVVFVATSDPAVFLQRTIRTGAEADGRTIILDGLSPGDRVVTEGSFLLRAESLKRNPKQSM